jgi:hypothetical protein
MKKSRFIFVGILFFSFHNTNRSQSDEWSGPRERVLLSNWSVNVNVGFTSYFGDLSQYDLQMTRKLIHESKPAFGLKLTKHIREKFLISGQVLLGGFKSNYKPENTFETDLVEYSLQAGLDIINLIFPRRNIDFGLEVYVGTGQFIFRTNVLSSLDGIQSPKTTSTGVPEFVYFFGGGLYHQISERFRFTVDLTIRQAQNDNIDKYLAHADFDYYSLLNIGVTFAIGRMVSFAKYESNHQVNRAKPVWRRLPD